MIARGLGLFLVLAGPAQARDLTGALIDALTAPAADGAALVAALEAQGFAVRGLMLTEAADLPDGISDPAYFHLSAEISETAQPAPQILLQCSRIGPGMLPHLTTPAEWLQSPPVVPVLQWADTVAFLPEAGSQLLCLADHLPVTPELARVGLPDRAAVLGAITARFASVVTEPLVEGMASDWVLYPPLPEAAPPAPDGPVVITAATLDAATRGRSVSLRYVHRGADALHELQIILHAPPGNGG